MLARELVCARECVCVCVCMCVFVHVSECGYCVLHASRCQHARMRACVLSQRVYQARTRLSDRVTRPSSHAHHPLPRSLLPIPSFAHVFTHSHTLITTQHTHTHTHTHTYIFHIADLQHTSLTISPLVV